MENLVDKASNNSAQKSNIQPVCSDNSLLNIQNSDKCAPEMQNSANVESEVPTVNDELNTSYVSLDQVNVYSETNSEESHILESHNDTTVSNNSFKSPNLETKDKTLTINITSKSPNAIRETAGSCYHSSNNKEDAISNHEKDEINKNVFCTSTSLQSLCAYKSDSEETDTETSSIDKEKRDFITEVTSLNMDERENSVNAAGSLCNYVIFSESSDDNTSDSEPMNQVESMKTDVILNSACYRKTKESSSDTETSSSEESDNDVDEEEVPVTASNTKTTNKRSEIPRVKGELSLEDLPPVPDLSTLKIDVKEEDCIQMGKIESIVDKLVMVQSMPNTPAYDVDTLLFLDKGKRPLGHVYDVIGPVTSPMYAIRFNSREEIDKQTIAKEMAVYSAPKTEHTQYVFLKELLRIKGSDASWQGDTEVPPEFVDFSDDEDEISATNCTNDEYQVCKKNKRKRNSLEAHQIFEMEMNQRNKLDSAYHKLKDSCEPKYKKTSNAHHNRNFNPFAGNASYATPNTNFVPPAFGILPQPQWSFVPSIPPPPAGFSMQPVFQNHFCQPFPSFGNNLMPFPPLNMPPPCTGTPQGMSVPAPPPQSVPPPKLGVPSNGNSPFPHQRLVGINANNLGAPGSQNDRTGSMNPNGRHCNPPKPSASQNPPKYNHKPPRLPMQNVPQIRSGPPPPIQMMPRGPPNFGMPPMYNGRPFGNCMQPHVTPAGCFRPNVNVVSLPKIPGTGPVCPLPYPPCLGLPKFNNTSPNVSSVGSRPSPPTGPHFSGNVTGYGHVGSHSAGQNGKGGRHNFGTQNGSGFYRKQF